MNEEDAQERIIKKTRPDDFIWELQNIDSVIQGKENTSAISLERGLETMMVVSAAHLSEEKKRTVRINYEKGFIPEALELI
jgi:hypothetical protein